MRSQSPSAAEPVDPMSTSRRSLQRQSARLGEFHKKVFKVVTMDGVGSSMVLIYDGCERGSISLCG